MKYSIDHRMESYTGKTGWDAPTLDASTPAELARFFGPLAEVQGALANLNDLTEGLHIRFHMMRAASGEKEFEDMAIAFARRAGAYWDPRYAEIEMSRAVKDCRVAVEAFNAERNPQARLKIRKDLAQEFKRDGESPRANAPITGRGWRR